MPKRKQFRWDRELYQLASRETRDYDNRGFLYRPEPKLVTRFRALWEDHRQKEDPLRVPLRYRYITSKDMDDCPF